MEDKKVYRFPKDEEKAKEFDIEHCKEADLKLFFFSKIEGSNKTFFGTIEEIIEELKPNKLPWNSKPDFSVKYYKEWFGKKNVVFYSDDKLNIIQAKEYGKTYVFDFWESKIKGKYVWNEACRLGILESYIGDLSKRLGLSL